MLVLWIYGSAAKEKKIHYSYQANTEKKSNVLSVILIGWQVIIRNDVKFKRRELISAHTKSILDANGRALS